MTMVEKMMSAMNEYADQLPETSRDAPFIRSHRKELALAALKAMREPGEAMALSVGSEWGPALEDNWQTMIDAAIAEGMA